MCSRPYRPFGFPILCRSPPGGSIRSLATLTRFYHRRFCGIPVIRTEIRKRIHVVYPDALPWGRKNIEQHAAFQAMWVQYDHLIAHASSGTNDLENIVITCGPCNFGRIHYSLEEVGLIDPRTREPVRSSWDGLERFR